MKVLSNKDSVAEILEEIIEFNEKDMSILNYTVLVE